MNKLNASLVNYPVQLAFQLADIAVENNRAQEIIDYSKNLERSIRENFPYVKPIFGSLAVNYWCNSACSYCQIWRQEKINSPLEKLLLAVDQLANLGVLMISLTGGEAALQANLDNVISKIRSHNIYSQVITNGTLLKPHILQKVMDAGLNGIILSLDTINPNTYLAIRGMSITPIIQNLENLLQIPADSRPLLALNCVISRKNIEEIEELVIWASERQISIGFQPIHPTFASTEEAPAFIFTENDLPLLYDFVTCMLKMQSAGFLVNNQPTYLESFPEYLVYRRVPSDFHCTTGFTTVVIDHQLNVKNCWSMKQIGNLDTELLDKVWPSTKSNENRLNMYNLKCPKCWTRAHTELRSDEWLMDLVSYVKHLASKQE